MKQFTITIPDNKEGIFLDMMKSIAYIKHIEDSTAIEIPEEHKQIVRERIKSAKPSDYMPWEEARKKLSL